MFYTAHGGLKATYIASWAHVAVIYIALCTFAFLVYASPNSQLGSISKVYSYLGMASEKYPVAGNKGGSYLTMFSKSGLIFGVINVIGNFGTVFVDQAYWQGAIACESSANATHLTFTLKLLMSILPLHCVAFEYKRWLTYAPYACSGTSPEAANIAISHTIILSFQASPVLLTRDIYWEVCAGFRFPFAWRRPWGWPPVLSISQSPSAKVMRG